MNKHCEKFKLYKKIEKAPSSSTTKIQKYKRVIVSESDSKIEFENSNVNSNMKQKQTMKRNFEGLDDIMVSLKKRKAEIIKCLDNNEESCNELKDLVIDEKDKNNQLIRKNIELSIELDFLKEKYRQIIIEKDMTIDILRKENYKKDQIIKDKDSEFQKVSNIVKEMSENETYALADEVKSAHGIPKTNVVSFDSEIKQEIKEELKTEVLDDESTSLPPCYSKSQHWTCVRKEKDEYESGSGKFIDLKDLPSLHLGIYSSDHDMAKILPRYNKVLNRSVQDGVGLEDIDKLQMELEVLLSSTVVRKKALKDDLKVLLKC